MTTNTTNYKDVYSWSTPSKIVGQPTLETIDQLENTLKKNATKTHSTLSDGLHGHLGLVLSPPKYALISNAPYNQPTLPAPLVIPPQTTAVQASNLRDIHNRATNLFFEVKQIKAQLLSQIEESIEEDYLKGMVNPATAQLEGEIWQILDTLKQSTQMTDEELEAHRDAIKNMDFNPTMPLDTVYIKIDKYVQISQNAGQPVTQTQAISLAMIILKKTGVFSRYIAEWKRRPLLQQTWILFKDFFRNAQNELRNSNSLTSQEALAQLNANMVAQQVTEQLLQHPVFHLEEANELPEASPAPAPAQTPPPDAHQINNASSMETLMQQLIQMMMNQQPPQQQQYQQQYYRGGGGRGGRGRGNSAGRGRGGRGPIIFNKYCWTHGLCTHTSSECRNRAQGHKENATLTNRMGGSDRNL